MPCMQIIFGNALRQDRVLALPYVFECFMFIYFLLPPLGPGHISQLGADQNQCRVPVRECSNTSSHAPDFSVQSFNGIVGVDLRSVLKRNVTAGYHFLDSVLHFLGCLRQLHCLALRTRCALLCLLLFACGLICVQVALSIPRYLSPRCALLPPAPSSEPPEGTDPTCLVLLHPLGIV